MVSGLTAVLKFVGSVILNVILFPFIWIHLRILDWRFTRSQKEKLAEQWTQE